MISGQAASLEQRFSYPECGRQRPIRSALLLRSVVRRRNRVRYAIHHGRDRPKIGEHGFQVVVRPGGNILPRHRRQNRPRCAHVLYLEASLKASLRRSTDAFKAD
jgi:hypothetical protein